MAKKILVVDDFESTRFVIKMTVKRGGYETYEAEDGISALRILKETKIDLLITDFNMPKMNGAELITEFRKIPDYEFTPILILTTETSQELKEKVNKLGVTAWIQKPFKVENLLGLIKKLLR